jgi:hypothetical protein
MDLRASFPNAVVVKHDQLVHAEVGKGPWRLYIYRADGYHEGGIWFATGKIKYPKEEITFSRAKQFCESAVRKGLEVRICDGMDWLVFHSVNGKVIHGSTFWNEAQPDPAAAKIADRLKGKK